MEPKKDLTVDEVLKEHENGKEFVVEDWKIKEAD